MRLFTPPEISRHTITCKLCAKQIAHHPALEIPLTGPLGPKAEKLEKLLQKHLYEEHQEQVMHAATIARGFIPFLVWNAFDTPDPSVAPRLEIIRAPIFGMVRKNSFSDEALQDLTARLELNKEEADRVYIALRMVRDACTEAGSFAPQMPEPSRVLQP